MRKPYLIVDAPARVLPEHVVDFGLAVLAELRPFGFSNGTCDLGSGNSYFRGNLDDEFRNAVANHKYDFFDWLTINLPLDDPDTLGIHILPPDTSVLIVYSGVNGDMASAVESAVKSWSWDRSLAAADDSASPPPEPLPLFFDLDTITPAMAARVVDALGVVFGNRLEIVRTRTLPPGHADSILSKAV